MTPTVTGVDNARIAVIGLGYVGLPLAAEFDRVADTIGFDINAKRIEDLQAGHDRTRELSAEELADIPRLCYSSTSADIAGCNVYIVTVPTPIDSHKRPNLGPLLKASEAVGKVLKSGDIVICESTVYPGAAEEDCVPVLEEHSGLKYISSLSPTGGEGQGEGAFYCGYSPERINPGDKQHRVADLVKVTSGSTPVVADIVDALYASIIQAGTHKAPSIKVAEAAKVIENTQRDLNIALVNELALIFNRLGIDTNAVLEAAGTKWNFLPFKPGLVGGHCIGVDPYYLTHKAQEVGYQPEVILAGRRINDGIGAYVAEQVIKEITRRKIHVVGSRILILGIAFKENCPDVRNTRVIDIVRELRSYNAQLDIYDPWVDAQEVEHEYGIRTVTQPETGAYDAIILAVAHGAFLQMAPEEYRGLSKGRYVTVYDIKSALPAEMAALRLQEAMRLLLTFLKVAGVAGWRNCTMADAAENAGECMKGDSGKSADFRACFLKKSSDFKAFVNG